MNDEIPIPRRIKRKASSLDIVVSTPKHSFRLHFLTSHLNRQRSTIPRKQTLAIIRTRSYTSVWYLYEGKTSSQVHFFCSTVSPRITISAEHDHLAWKSAPNACRRSTLMKSRDGGRLPDNGMFRAVAHLVNIRHCDAIRGGDRDHVGWGSFRCTHDCLRWPAGCTSDGCSLETKLMDQVWSVYERDRFVSLVVMSEKNGSTGLTASCFLPISSQWC